MKEQIAIQNLLRRKLNELQLKNSQYSVRAFAMRLGMQAAATNEILKGERRVSQKLAERIATRLLLDPTERAALLKYFTARKAKASVMAVRALWYRCLDCRLYGVMSEQTLEVKLGMSMENMNRLFDFVKIY